MKSFLKNIVVFLVLVFLVFFTLDILVTQGLLKRECVWNKIIRGEICSTILINGSSRALKHVNPLTMEDVFDAPTYNIGYNAYHFYMQNFRYQKYVENNSYPKIVLVLVDIFGLKKRDKIMQREDFLPLIFQKSIRDKTKEFKGMKTIDYYLPYIRYRSRNMLVAWGLLEEFKLSHVHQSGVNGYRPTDEIWRTWQVQQFFDRNREGIVQDYDTISLRSFEMFLRSSKKNDVTVIIVYPPEYFEVQSLYLNREEIISIYRSFAYRHDIPFIDYSDHWISYSRDLFYNTQHLNEKGAEIFTKCLCEDLADLTVFNNALECEFGR